MKRKAFFTVFVSLPNSALCRIEIDAEGRSGHLSLLSVSSGLFLADNPALNGDICITANSRSDIDGTSLTTGAACAVKCGLGLYAPGFRFGTGLKGLVMRAGERTVRTLLLSTGIDLVIGEESPFFIIEAEYGYPIAAGIVTQGGERKTHSRSSFRTQEKHASISPYSIHSDDRASMQ